ncbi:MAG: peptidoglycan-binding domain-containing protein [Candidatus Spechtbacterales bacterium]
MVKILKKSMPTADLPKVRQKHKLFIAGSLFVVATLILGSFWLVYNAPPAEALHGSAGQPAHSHDGWPCLNCGSFSSSYIEHLQAELNWMHEELLGFKISSGYPLAVDGAWGTNTENAVKDFQSHVDILLDGKVGNQTWTYMEFWVMTSPSIGINASAHPPSVTIKYPIYAECRAISHTNGSDLATPLWTKAEWNAYRSNAPNLSDVAGDCSITEGTGSDDGTSDDDGGSTDTTDGEAARCVCKTSTDDSIVCSTSWLCGDGVVTASSCDDWCWDNCAFNGMYSEVQTVCSTSCNNSGC